MSREDEIALRKAMEEIRAGRFEVGGGLAASVPMHSPVYPQACHLLGIVAMQAARHAEAIDLLKRAAALGDRSPTLAGNLAQAGALARRVDAELVDAIREVLVRHRTAAEVATTALPLLQALGFQRANGYEHTAMLTDRLALPLLEWSLQRQCFDLPLQLEWMVYDRHIKQRETEEYFRSQFNRMVPAMLAAGRALRPSLPPAKLPPSGTPLRIGFYLDNMIMLAHVEALVGVLRGYRQLAAQPFEPVIYAFGGHDDKVLSAMRELDIPVVRLELLTPEAKASWYQRVLLLRERIAADDITCITWLSVPLKMPFCFATRIAPVQVWWTMKYHGLDFEEIDGNLTSLSFARTVNVQGRTWRSGRLQTAGRFLPELAAEAAEIAAKYWPNLILGTIAREEKMTDPAFLGAISRILRDNPGTVFLWAGRSAHADIVGWFAREGLADRHVHIGWVNTKLYAQVLDVFLDSFPFGCGFTALEAMAAAKPVLFMGTVTEGDPSLDQLIWPVVSGAGVPADEHAEAAAIFGAGDACLYQHASGVDDYVARAGRLVRDADYRARVGEAYRDFVERMMSDPTRTAQDYTDHFMAIIAERKEKIAHGG